MVNCKLPHNIGNMMKNFSTNGFQHGLTSHFIKFYSKTLKYMFFTSKNDELTQFTVKISKKDIPHTSPHIIFYKTNLVYFYFCWQL